MPVRKIDQDQEQDSFEGKKTVKTVGVGIAEWTTRKTDKKSGNQKKNYQVYDDRLCLQGSSPGVIILLYERDIYLGWEAVTIYHSVLYLTIITKKCWATGCSKNGTGLFLSFYSTRIKSVI